jgi:hypothetical protein
VVSTPLKNIVHIGFPSQPPWKKLGQGEALWLLATDSENLAQQALELPEAPHFCWAQWLEKRWKYWNMLFPTCQVRVVRFYVRWGSLEDSKLFLKLSKVATQLMNV